jgi:hypothetical protein
MLGWQLAFLFCVCLYSFIKLFLKSLSQINRLLCSVRLTGKNEQGGSSQRERLPISEFICLRSSKLEPLLLSK